MRTVPLDDVTADALDAYLSIRIPPKDGKNTLFVSVRKGQLRRGAVEKMLRKAVKLAGPSFSGITARDLQMTARGRLIEREGYENAAAITNISCPFYFRRAYTSPAPAGANS